MSNKWVTFPCTMGEHQAWISLDAGVAEEIDSSPFRYSTHFRVVLKNPDDRGLPFGDEFAGLNAIEDALCEKIDDNGVQVGRITSNGSRYFFFYTNFSEEEVQTLAEGLASTLDRQILYVHEIDIDRRSYWSQLYPTPSDWQVISDLDVEQSLKENGDDLSVIRRIDHWAYFTDAESAGSFVNQLKDKFPEIDFEINAQENDTKVTFHHESKPDYRSINPFTVFSDRIARECGGRYDGWETVVCK